MSHIKGVNSNVGELESNVGELEPDEIISHEDSLAISSHTESHSAPHIPGIQGHVFYDNPVLPISNVLLSTWLVMLFLIAVAFKVSKDIKVHKMTRFMHFCEMTTEFFYTQFYSFLKSKRLVKKYFFIVATVFVFIVASNLFWLLIDFLESFIAGSKFLLADYLRSPNSDLNTTLALGLSAVIITNIVGIQEHGVWGYFKRFLFNFKGSSLVEKFVNLCVGFLEIISEISKIVSLSFRLFGNMFAGTILLVIVVYLLRVFPVFVPLPFFLLEILVSFVQALVFTGLFLAYLKSATESHEH